MTAQQAPHSPLWRRVLSLPHTRLGWWAIGLASIALIDIAVGNFIDLEREVSPPWLGAALAIISLITVLVAPLAGGVVGALALGAGECSLLVWFAEVPPAIFFAVLLNLFQEGNPWPRVAVAVFFWAAIAFGIGYLRHGYLRQGRSS